MAILLKKKKVFSNFNVDFHRLAPVFALFVPFYSSIPRVPVTKVLGLVSITNKTLVYIVGLQVWFCSAFWRVE